jgi:Ca2+-binding RTX toxin-like protein
LLEFGNDDGIRFENWLVHKEKPLKEVVFADGTVWGEDWLEKLYPYGTAGNDLLYLDERDDTVAGGLGRDEIHGGRGTDTYLFALGDGEDLIVETASPTDRNVLRFTDGILPDDIQISRDGLNLLLSHRNGTDRVTLKDWFSEDEKRPLARVEFADGSVWAGDDWYRPALSVSGTTARDYLTGLSGYPDTLSGLGGDDVLDGDSGDDWLSGGPGQDTLYGDAGNDELHGAAGDDLLYGHAGNDSLTGGAGADTLNGGAGDDLYHVDPLDTLVEYADNGTDTVVTSSAWTLGEHFENLLLVGNDAVDGTGNELDNRIRGNDAANRLTGGAGADFLWGRGGDDVLDGGAGADTLVGDGGNDSYLFGAGYGRDTIVENDSTVGNLDSVRLLDGVSADQLWFRRLDEHLDVQVAGTTDSLQIKDWYKGDAHRVERFTTADGKTLLDSQVQSLVDAMASFGVPAGAEANLTPDQRAQLEVVIAANWQ